MLDVGTFVRLKEDIKNADHIVQLRSLRDQFQLSIQHNEQIYHKDSIALWNFHINELHDAFIAKTIALAELRMAGEGRGLPPASYCYLLLGSAGRSEQTLASDQDSALVFETMHDTEHAKRYFKTFAAYIVSNLVELGYPPCDGKVQSDEDLWCQSEDEWKAKLDHWYEDASWEAVRYLLIVADARRIVGDDSLFCRVQTYYRAGLKIRPYMLERMIKNTVQHKMLTGVFGQFITERYGQHRGSIDVKYGSYIPIVNSVRWLALSSEIVQPSTLKRLEGLAERKVISEQEHAAYRDLFLHMLSLRLRAGYRIEEKMYVAVSKLNPKRLDVGEIKRLKKSLRLGKELQKLVLRKNARL